MLVYETDRKGEKTLLQSEQGRHRVDKHIQSNPKRKITLTSSISRMWEAEWNSLQSQETRGNTLQVFDPEMEAKRLIFAARNSSSRRG